MRKKNIRRILLIVSLSLQTALFGQSITAVKSNLLYDATGTFSLGIEKTINRKVTIDVSGSYNPWEFSRHYKWKHWLVQPEIRYWRADALAGHFWGVNFWGGQYNAAWKNTRYQGWLYGAGVGYGYAWTFSPHWGMETELGVGYARVKYDYFKCLKCQDIDGTKERNYWGPTKAALSLIYVF